MNSLKVGYVRHDLLRSYEEDVGGRSSRQTDVGFTHQTGYGDDVHDVLVRERRDVSLQTPPGTVDPDPSFRQIDTQVIILRKNGRPSSYSTVIIDIMTISIIKLEVNRGKQTENTDKSQPRIDLYPYIHN